MNKSKCLVPICKRSARAKGLCAAHYRRLKYFGSLYDKSGKLELDKPRNLKHIGCKVAGCVSYHYSKGYCKLHYIRFINKNELDKPYCAHDKNTLQPKFCIIKNCNAKNNVKGYCSKHYYRLKNHKPMYIDNLRKGENSHFWRGGVSEYPNHHIMKKNRKILLSQHKYCQNCKTALAVEVHHIDESKDNHNIENLMVVCSKCNSNLSTKVRTSKYRRLYGWSLKEMGEMCGIPEYNIYYRLNKNKQIKTLLS